jgi:predicted DNA-binding antitoxin AbrB/MazE fold protein
MTKTTDAIFSNGLLRPLEPLPLREQERVRITVESVEPEGTAVKGAAEARRSMIAGFDKMRLRTNGKPPSREELHERG